MSRYPREDLDKYFEYGCYPPSRMIYLGSRSYTNDSEESGTDFQMSDHFIKAITYLDSRSSDPIYIHMNNLGGDWYHGMAIYDAIVSSRCHVTITAWGQAMSMGSIILQAADLRILSPNAIMMIHDGFESINGSSKTAENWAKESKKSRYKMYEIYQDKMKKKLPKITIKKIEKLCSHDTIYSAQQAVDIGLADSVLDKMISITTNE